MTRALMVPQILLASGSPRRRELLRLLNLPYDVCSTDVDETPLPGESPADMVARLSRAKAEAGHRDNPAAVIIACDTTVEMDGQIFGKPEGPDDARRMLRELRNREHRVYGGITVCYPLSPVVRAAGASSDSETMVVCTRVWMRDYTDEEIGAYVASGDPLDKAASYAVQHPLFRPVLRMEGCFANVMGLALCRLYDALAARYAMPAPDILCYRHPESDCTVARLVREGKVAGA